MAGSQSGGTTTQAASQSLERWLAAKVENYQGPGQLTRFEGGQSNPTFKIESPSGRYVLRAKPPGQLLPKAHAIDREFRVQRALAGSAVPVARMHGYCSDGSVFGQAFYVMDLVEGRIFWDQRLPELSRAERAGIFDSLNQTIANLHMVDFSGLGLADYGRPDAFLERQINRWSRQYQASETDPIEAMNQLIEWLPKRIPAQQGSSIVHGDFRLDNVIIHPERPEIVAVLDWELSTIGDPIADFAYHTMAWRLAPDLFRGLAGVEFDALGIPPEEDYVSRYCERTGRPQIPDWEFYMVYSLFRIAAILQGVAKRATEGNASSKQAEEVGRKARPIGEQAWELARQIAS